MSPFPLSSVLKETPLRTAVTCPNCWHCFPPEAVLWIAVHPKLAGEPQLPASLTHGAERRRFIPERFDVEGRAIDAEGAPCTQLACPRCRLLVPRACLELPGLVFSVLGAPGSGKSVFLASMTFALRQRAADFGMRFQDADLTLNRLLLEDERRIFLDSGAEKYRPIDDAVKKTQLDDARYRVSLIDGHPAKFVPPYTFVLSPGAGHPHAREAGALTRLLCLYDNAGEHFLPGADGAEQPMTRHLAASKGLIYTFDPTRDRRVQRRLGTPASSGVGVDRQDSVLLEAANRVREHGGISPTARIPQPLVVALTKFDVWQTLVAKFDKTPPFHPYPNASVQSLFIDPVAAMSQACRAMLWEHCREIVVAAESVSDDVTYVPVAAVGWDIRVDPRTKQPHFRSADCDPFGVLIPLLLLLHKNVSRLCLAVGRAGI